MKRNRKHRVSTSIRPVDGASLSRVIGAGGFDLSGDSAGTVTIPTETNPPFDLYRGYLVVTLP